MKKLAIMGVIVLLAGGIYLGVVGWRASGPGPTATIQRGTLHQIIAATGRVEALTEVQVAAKIPGKIKAVLVKEGDPVKEGQPVLLFDAADLHAQVRQAEAGLRNAEAAVRAAEAAEVAARSKWAEVKSGSRSQEIERARAELAQAERSSAYAELHLGRARDLFAKGLIARQDLDQAQTEADITAQRARSAREALSLTLAGPKQESIDAAWAQVEQAQAQIRQAQAQVEYARAFLANTVLRSTINGKVIRKLVEPGEAVDIGIPLLTIADIRRVRVKVEVDETDVGKLRLDQPVLITSDAYPGQEFRGHVEEIGWAMGKRGIRPEDPKKITDMKVLESKVAIDDATPDQFKIGMSVDVKIIVVHKEGVLAVPLRALEREDGQVRVRVVEGREARRREVRLGLRDDEKAEVLEGLREGEHVLLPKR